jgi:hypothetical protein
MQYKSLRIMQSRVMQLRQEKKKFKQRIEKSLIYALKHSN